MGARYSAGVGDEAAATTNKRSPYAEFMHILTTHVLPVFEDSSVVSPGMVEGSVDAASTPNSLGTPIVEGRSHASQSVVGSDANLSHSGGGGDSAADLFITGSINSESLFGSDRSLLPTDIAETEAMRTRSTARVIELEVADASQVKEDAELARALLPEPQVPAPDPKLFAIPPEKVRQLLRRPVTRVQRTPLQRLEILPVVVDSPPPTPSSPSSQTERTSKTKRNSKTKAEQAEASSSTAKEIKGDEGNVEGGGQVRASSGALEGNPYRWVVSIHHNIAVSYTHLTLPTKA